MLLYYEIDWTSYIADGRRKPLKATFQTSLHVDHVLVQSTFGYHRHSIVSLHKYCLQPIEWSACLFQDIFQIHCMASGSLYHGFSLCGFSGCCVNSSSLQKTA